MLSKIINRGYEANQCSLCKCQFSLLKFQRIHKCKRCSKYVCWRCGQKKQKVMDEDGKWSQQLHRVCNPCFGELQHIYKMVDEKGMKWGKNSIVSEEWIKRMWEDVGKRASLSKGDGRDQDKDKGKQKDYQYQHFLKLFNTNYKNFQEEFDIIDKDVIKGRTDYNVFNYSLRQFFYIVQNNDDRQRTRRNMANVLYAVAARFDQVGYVQGMSSIAAFLLCFCSEQSAYTIFCDLIENILPQKFLVRGNYGVNLIGLLAETHFLKQYFIHILTKIKGPLISHFRQAYTQQQIQHYRMIVQLSASKCLLSLFVNVLAYSHIEFIWKQLSLHRSFQVIERSFLAMLYLRRQEIVQRRSFKDLEASFQGLEFGEWVQAYYDMDIDGAIKEKLIQEYYEGLDKKWSNNSQQNVKQLHRCTNFTQEQIKLLQQKFTKKSSFSSTSVCSSSPCSQPQKQQKQKCGVISKQDFVLLIKCYYDILKQNAENQAPILQITSHFVSKIFDTFVTNKNVNHNSPIMRESKIEASGSGMEQGRNGGFQEGEANRSTVCAAKSSYLDFREFVCCFSLCTKSLLKDRMCAILNTFQDRNKKISFNSFSKLVKNLCEISPEDIEDKKQAFIERMNRYFSNQQQGITINQLYILLNDNFINQLTVYIRSDSPNIIARTVDKFYLVTGKDQNGGSKEKGEKRKQENQTPKQE